MADPSGPKARCESAKRRFDAIMETYGQDERTVFKDERELFHSNLEDTLQIATRKNIQTCSKWIIDNILVHEKRITAFGNYLYSLSNWLYALACPKELTLEAAAGVNPIRKRLNLVYLIYEVLHSAQHKGNNDQFPHDKEVEYFGEAMKDTLKSLAVCKTLLHRSGDQNYQVLVLGVLKLMEVNALLDTNFLKELRYMAVDSGPDGMSAIDLRSSSEDMPPYHGDHNTPWFDMPAGNMVRHLKLNPTAPIKPQDMAQPVPLPAGPPSPKLMFAMHEFLGQARSLCESGPEKLADNISHLAIHESKDEGIVADLDEIGQVSIHYPDKSSHTVQTYWGWSPELCEQINTESGQPRTENPRLREVDTSSDIDFYNESVSSPDAQADTSSARGLKRPAPSDRDSYSRPGSSLGGRTEGSPAGDEKRRALPSESGPSQAPRRDSVPRSPGAYHDSGGRSSSGYHDQRGQGSYGGPAAHNEPGAYNEYHAPAVPAPWQQGNLPMNHSSNSYLGGTMYNPSMGPRGNASWNQSGQHNQQYHGQYPDNMPNSMYHPNSQGYQPSYPSDQRYYPGAPQNNQAYYSSQGYHHANSSFQAQQGQYRNSGYHQGYQGDHSGGYQGDRNGGYQGNRNSGYHQGYQGNRNGGYTGYRGRGNRR